MDAREIIEALAKEKRVEQIILRISGADALNADLSDLSQMIYLSLLEYDADKIEDLWESGAINFFIVRLVLSNLRSNTSRYYYAIKKFSAISQDLATIEQTRSDEG